MIRWSLFDQLEYKKGSIPSFDMDSTVTFSHRINITLMGPVTGDRHTGNMQGVNWPQFTHSLLVSVGHDGYNTPGRGVTSTNRRQ